jgi:hypothetical protein
MANINYKIDIIFKLLLGKENRNGREDQQIMEE